MRTRRELFLRLRRPGLRLLWGKIERLPPGAEALRDALRIYQVEVEIVREAGAKIDAGRVYFADRVRPSVRPR